MSNHNQGSLGWLSVLSRTAILCLVLTGGLSYAEPPKDATGPNKWENDISKLEALDSTEIATENAILFVGSSSIRRWESIHRDMAPYATIRRGFGGCRYNDVAHYATRLITPHDYRALVLFVGNDVKGSDADHSVAQVEHWASQTIDVAQAHRPHAPIFLIEVTPTPKRFAAWSEIADVNARLRRITLTRPGVFFIATAEHYLGFDKQPRKSLFDRDDLHLNERGYELWATLIRHRLDEVFRMVAQDSEPVCVEESPSR